MFQKLLFVLHLSEGNFNVTKTGHTWFPFYIPVKDFAWNTRLRLPFLKQKTSDY